MHCPSLGRSSVESGEAGRGFAVVATEIGKLADDSQQSANQIVGITQGVIDSVNHLSDCAKEILNFVQDTVMGDYDNMVDTGESYNEDAQSINIIVSEMNATTEKLLGTINDMVNMLEQVSCAAGESAQGTSSIAESNTDIAMKTHEISEMAEDTKNAVVELKEVIDKFKIS